MREYKVINSLQVVPARWYGRDRAQSANVIVLHTTESPEKTGGARAVANYFHDNLIKTSAHIVVDNLTAIRCVSDNNRAWAAPPLNTRGLHLEMVGSARQNTKNWADPYSTSMLAIAAKICADWSIKFNIPIRRLTVTQLKSGLGGFCGHADVSKAYRQTDHTDPGVYFPWTEFLRMVNRELA